MEKATSNPFVPRLSPFSVPLLPHGPRGAAGLAGAMAGRGGGNGPAMGPFTGRAAEAQGSFAGDGANSTRRGRRAEHARSAGPARTGRLPVPAAAAAA